MVQVLSVPGKDCWIANAVLFLLLAVAEVKPMHSSNAKLQGSYHEERKRMAAGLQANG